jgi:hypothetical protein
MIISKNLTHSSIPEIDRFIDQHSKMYGVPFSRNDLIEKIKKMLDSNNSIVGAFEGDKLIGICTQVYWDNYPFWSFSNMFVESPPSMLFNTKVAEVLGSLLDQTIKNAEALERFEFYYLYRDTRSYYRKKQTFDVISNSNPEVASRYDYQTLHEISKPEDVKWKYMEWFLGDIGMKAISPPYNKTLYLRRAIIKQKFRKV